MELQVIRQRRKIYCSHDKNGKLLYTVSEKKASVRDIISWMQATIITFILSFRQVMTKSLHLPIILNDNVFMTMECTSMFLDPTIKSKRHKTMHFELSSKDRKDFDIILDGNNVGHIHTLVGCEREIAVQYRDRKYSL